ncbi:MAG: sulfatase [Halioglobus sp.]
MAIISFLWRRLISLLGTAFLLVLLVALFVVVRVTGNDQEDDRELIASKKAYLSHLNSGLERASERPNILFILYDDLGYGDIGAGAVGVVKTPNIDQLAANGVVLSDFHSPAPVCTPARAGFLTGRLPLRAGLPNVVFPTGSAQAMMFNDLLDPTGHSRLPTDEITLPEILNAVGYRTGMVGKWHMGDRSPSLPNNFGFDSFYGALYSNDMEPFAFYRNTEVELEAPVDQRKMSEIYTNEVTTFIEAQSDAPFFLYFAHNFPHDPLFVSEERSGQSDAGLYGDVLEELDDGIGQIVASLEKTGQLENTLIIISSDNGPWFLGDAGDQRGRKGSTFEGGMRVPFIAHWPRKLAGGRVESAMGMGIDLVPTILDVLSLPAPTDRLLDGKSMHEVLLNGAATPHDYLYHFDGEILFAVRDQRFKYRGDLGIHYAMDQMPVSGRVPRKEWLFDLAADPRESYDASDRYPRDLARLRLAFTAKQREMEVNKRGWN